MKTFIVNAIRLMIGRVFEGVGLWVLDIYTIRFTVLY